MGDNDMGKIVAFGALLMNAVICAAWAAQADTFIISNAVLAAALVAALVIEGD